MSATEPEDYRAARVRSQEALSRPDKALRTDPVSTVPPEAQNQQGHARRGGTLSPKRWEQQQRFGQSGEY